MKTSDMGLAVTLMTLGHDMQSVDATRTRAEFLFEDSSELEKHVSDFRNRKLRIEPNKFLINFKLVKNQLYNN